MNRSQHIAFAVILVLAALLRFVHTAELADYVLLQVPLVDAQENFEWAARLAQGGNEASDVYYKPPLYPHVLSWAMRLGGVRLQTAYVLNAFLGVLNVWLLGLWVRRFASVRMALITAGLGAMYGPLLYYEVQALPTILGVTLSLVSLLLLTPRRRSLPRLFLAGVVLGLLVLTRPSFLLWVLVACLWLLGRRGDWRAAGVVALATLLTLLPVTLRNRVRGGAWVLVSANGGINFYLGNNANWQRTWLLRPGLEWEELVRRIPEAERRGQARWDRYFGERALHWVAHEPLDFVAALGRKGLQSFSQHELDRNLDLEGFRAQGVVLRWAPRYACLAAWLLVGGLWAWRRAGPARLAVLFGLAVHASMALVFVNERYRLDAVAASLPLAVAGMGACVAALRRQEGSMRPVTCVTLLALGSLLAYVDWGGLGAARGPRAAALEGMAYYQQQRFELAAARLQQALEEDPQDADASYQLGTALQHLGRPAEALRAFERSAELVPGHPKPAMAAGWLLRQQGRLEEALQRYERACAQDPRNAMVQLETASLLEEMGRRDAARRRYGLALQHATEGVQANEARRGLERLR